MRGFWLNSADAVEIFTKQVSPFRPTMYRLWVMLSRQMKPVLFTIVLPVVYKLAFRQKVFPVSPQASIHVLFWPNTSGSTSVVFTRVSLPVKLFCKWILSCPLLPAEHTNIFLGPVRLSQAWLKRDVPSCGPTEQPQLRLATAGLPTDAA